MTCETAEYGEIPTLEVAISPRGGFRELRAYSEVTVFLVIDDYERGVSEESKKRATFVLNHFLDLYRLITQDPYVHRVDEELHLYFIDYSLGAVPAQYRTDDARTILSHLDEVNFPHDIGPNRNVKIRLNTLEDLFPGRILSDEHLRSLIDLAPQRYDTPLHYELIFNAQSSLHPFMFCSPSPWAHVLAKSLPRPGSTVAHSSTRGLSGKPYRWGTL